MAGLLYRRDIDQVRDRLTAWWNGTDIGRPPLQITVRRETPIEEVPVLPEPDGWVTDYSTSDFAYRVNLSARACIHTHYLGEAVPVVAPDLGPNCLALYLGCEGVDMPGTVWFKPCIEQAETARFDFDETNDHWQYTLRLLKEQMRLASGKFMLQFPDLIEGLDTLAAMRGTQELLVDLIERPDWVHASLNQITERYFDVYDVLYDMIKDERGGSHYWAWAPGRMTKFQCDFSAMISPEMFGEFMVPALRALSEGVDYSMYHWDGPGAIPHHDHLLSVPGITMLQWTPGAGVESVMDRRWWPLYHKTVEAGKKMILFGVSGLEGVRVLRKEFGSKLKQFMLGVQAETEDEAQEIIKLVSD